jgi:hypothetical protein
MGDREPVSIYTGGMILPVFTDPVFIDIPVFVSTRIAPVCIVAPLLSIRFPVHSSDPVEVSMNPELVDIAHGFSEVHHEWIIFHVPVDPVIVIPVFTDIPMLDPPSVSRVTHESSDIEMLSTISSF